MEVALLVNPRGERSFSWIARPIAGDASLPAKKVIQQNQMGDPLVFARVPREPGNGLEQDALPVWKLAASLSPALVAKPHRKPPLDLRCGARLVRPATFAIDEHADFLESSMPRGIGAIQSCTVLVVGCHSVVLSGRRMHRPEDSCADQPGTATFRIGARWQSR